ncbi:MAG: Rieske 2Fe-2S domain-containing protein [Alphaproteobacteria bacterium]
MRAAGPGTWYPVCAGHDLPFRHVFHGQLLGQELAVWRADDGHVNVWENRCPHRGVRLSIGGNDGAELKCAYHGWRFASRSGGCTYVPSHPGEAPSATLCARRFPAVERHGLIWTTFAGDGDLPRLDGVPHDALALRGIAVDAPSAAVEAALAGFDATIRCFVQPVDAGRCTVRGVFLARPADAVGALRAAIARLTALRDRLEAAAAGAAVAAESVPAAVATPAPARPRSLAMRVVAKDAAGEGIVALRLEPVDGADLPAFQPGAHVDLHLPGGLVRQYSLTNGPEDVTGYALAVKLEADGRGGSRTVHERIGVGDVLTASAPHNNFTLRRDTDETLLIAGGIGVTPLVAMAKALARMRLGCAFHVFARSAAHLPLAQHLAALRAETHLGLDAAGTEAALAGLLARPGQDRHVYICGPRPMLDAGRRIAEAAGWDESQVHFEYFANDAEIDKSTRFEVVLARSGITLAVDPGRTILETVRAAGIAVESSCEQGACGTCLCGVIAGEPEHQDVYLSDAEKAKGDRIALCVSRSRTPQLTLDL